MALLPVKNLTELGVVSDVAPFELPPNGWTDANNVSFEDGAVVKSSAHIEVMKPVEKPVGKMYIKGKKVYYTNDDGIWVFDGASHQNISNPDATYVKGAEWFISELSNVLVFSNRANIPQYLPTAGGNTLNDLPGWGDQWRTPIIREYKNFLIALGMQEIGAEFSQRIKWSDITPPNAPPASWDAYSTTNSAGFNDLSEAKGKIVDGLSLGDSFMIYTEDEVFSMDFVAGNDIFRFRKVLDKVSIIAPECVARVQGGHFVVTKDDVIVHNGNSFSSIISGKIRKRLFEEIKGGNPRYVKVQANPSRSEVWILYPQFSSNELTKAAVFNTSSGVWTFKDVPNATTIAYGVLPDSDLKIIDAQTQIIDTDGSIIDGVGTDFVRSSLLAASSDLKFYAINEGPMRRTRSSLPSQVTKTYIDFDEAGLAHDSIKHIMGIHPQIQGSGTINISVGTSMSPYEQPKWSRPVKFDIQKHRKADFRVTGRYISIKFESFDNTAWKLFGYAIDFKERGKR